MKLIKTKQQQYSEMEIVLRKKVTFVLHSLKFVL